MCDAGLLLGGGLPRCQRSHQQQDGRQGVQRLPGRPRRQVQDEVDAGSAPLQWRSCGVDAKEDAPLEWRAPSNEGKRLPLSLIAEQLLNGLQLGLMLFLLAAGLTLVFGIMDMINLAHGSLYMIGAYIAATVIETSGSFLLGIAGAISGTALVGAALEMTLLRRLYRRSHLSQVLAPFAVILIANGIVRMIWGSPP